ncbi:MAG TPA: hypothetical protein VFT99_12130 [Roseiflexaceae bacterium]|nr:hypothetical protein [Roseiflexaceae bacterium]
MHNVIITNGAFAGRTGIARPNGAIGQVDARVFLVVVTFDDGCFVELPISAVADYTPVTAAQNELDSVDRQIAACYHCHPHLGEVVIAGRERALRDLKQRRFVAIRNLAAQRSMAGAPLSVSGAMWMVNQADAGYF